MRRGMWLAAAALVAAAVLVPTAAQADPTFYAAPIFGINTAPGKALYVADAGKGIVNADTGALVASLPGVNDVAPIGRGSMWAVTTVDNPDERAKGAVHRIENGSATQIADTLAFEDAVDPAGDGTDEGSNPFDLARLTGGQMLVADAAGNDLLVVHQDRGSIGSRRSRRGPMWRARRGSVWERSRSPSSRSRPRLRSDRTAPTTSES